MASTYSNLKIQLMGTGENSGTWGTITNTNLGTAIEEAICESADVAFSGDSVVLSLSDSNASQTARHLRLNLTGTGSAGITLTVPDIEKNYIVNNSLSVDVGIKNSSGSQVTVPNGRSAIVYSTGSGVVDAITSLNTAEVTDLTVTTKLSADGTLDVSGNGSVGGTFNVEGDLKNDSGNLTVDPATQIFEIKGDGSSTEGQIQLNCRDNSHGQIIKSQDHSAGVTNSMLLPRGASSTLVSEVGTATITNKTLDAVVSVSAAGALTASTVSDTDGNLRDVPKSGSTKTDAYTFAIGDVGNHILYSSANVNFTVPASTFDTGDVISVISTNGATGTISAAITTMFVAEGASATATATIGANGLCSLVFISASHVLLTGNVS